MTHSLCFCYFHHWLFMRAGQTTGDVKSKQWLVGPYHDPQYFSVLFMSQFVPLAGLGTDG